MQSDELETIKRVAISAAKLEKHFDAGLRDFKVLLNEVGNTESDELIELLEAVTEEIAAARK